MIDICIDGVEYIVAIVEITLYLCCYIYIDTIFDETSTYVVRERVAIKSSYIYIYIYMIYIYIYMIYIYITINRYYHY
jgi:hypothetical protein